MRKQMAADGSFPAELKRTKPYAYSIFQLDNMAALCQVLSTPGDDLWRFELPDGRGIRKATAYLYPYLGRQVEVAAEAGRAGVGGLARAAAKPALRRNRLSRAAIPGIVEEASARPPGCRSPPQHGHHATGIVGEIGPSCREGLLEYTKQLGAADGQARTVGKRLAIELSLPLAKKLLL